MKRIVCAVLLAASASMSVGAQEFVAPRPIRPPPPAPPPLAPTPGIQGILAEAMRMKRPWELVNPLAPAEYGRGEKTVSRDPNDPEKPKGFILLAFEW